MSEKEKEIQNIDEKKTHPYISAPRDARRVQSICGSSKMVKIRYFVDKEGVEQAEPGEVVDLDAYIQSSKASCDIEQIIARYNAGDETVLNVNPNGMTGDLSIIPQNINDVEKIYRMSEIARDNYDKLPDAVKSAFGSPENFFNAVLSNKAEDIVKSIKVEEKSSPESEAK